MKCIEVVYRDDKETVVEIHVEYDPSEKIKPKVLRIEQYFLMDFTEEHAKSYNELVVTVRRNISMADWNDPSHVESLLNPKQWKFRSNTIRNVRLSCCVAGHIKVSDAGHDI